MLLLVEAMLKMVLDDKDNYYFRRARCERCEPTAIVASSGPPSVTRHHYSYTTSEGSECNQSRLYGALKGKYPPVLKVQSDIARAIFKRDEALAARLLF